VKIFVSGRYTFSLPPLCHTNSIQYIISYICHTYSIQFIISYFDSVKMFVSMKYVFSSAALPHTQCTILYILYHRTQAIVFSCLFWFKPVKMFVSMGYIFSCHTYSVQFIKIYFGSVKMYVSMTNGIFFATSPPHTQYTISNILFWSPIRHNERIISKNRNPLSWNLITS